MENVKVLTPKGQKLSAKMKGRPWSAERKAEAEKNKQLWISSGGKQGYRVGRKPKVKVEAVVA